MRAITKGPEPPSLTTYRQTAGSNYGNYGAKDELRRALVTEQRGLCCYCMDRIHDDGNTRIEHWRAQSRWPDLQLVYRNLLAACHGGKGPRSKQHCDTRKRDRELLWNPADPTRRVEARIYYGVVDGSIWSDDGTFNAELDDVLNLNLPTLRNHRKGMLDSVAEWYKKTRGRSGARSRLQSQRARWLPAYGELQPFCQVAVWAIDQRLSRLGQ